MGRLGYITSPPTRLRLSHRNHRYYVPLRLPLPISGRFTFAPFPIPCCFPSVCVSRYFGTHRRAGATRSAPGLLIIRYPFSSGFILSKETGGSPKFVSCPSTRMPRSKTPVVSLTLAISCEGLMPSRLCNSVGFHSVSGAYPNGPPFTCFGIQCRGLRTRFPSASHTPSQGSHFGSTTRLLATL